MLDTAKVLQEIASETMTEVIIESMVNALANTSRTGGTVFVFGNGGSAADADHFVGELLGQKFGRYRLPIRAQTLSNESAALTAVSNDHGAVNWPAFAVPFMTEHDALLILSTSFKDHTGLGSNVVKLVDTCRESPRSPKLLAITGLKVHSSGMDTRKLDYLFVVPSHDTPTVQEVTICVLHEIMRRLDTKLGS